MKTDGSDQNERLKSLERSPVQSLKEMLNSEYAKKRFMEVMGEKSAAFLASVLNAAQKNPELAKCDPQSVLSSAMVAATLDLPIDSNLGFSAIVPYNTKRRDKDGMEYWVSLAQFQIMYKGFIQLALRSGQYKTINVSPIYEDEFESYDIITGDILIHPVEGGFREQENEDKIIGYVAFFRLLNGYERLEYWSLKKIMAHGERYSKSFENKNSLWKKNPHAMCAKTILKNTLSKWGILSVSMQTAIIADQAVIKSLDKPITRENVRYIDGLPPETGTPGDGHENAGEGGEPKAQEKTAAAPPSESGTAETVPAGGRKNGGDEVSARAASAPPKAANPAPHPAPAQQGNGNLARKEGDSALFPADEAADLEGVEPPDFG